MTEKSNKNNMNLINILCIFLFTGTAFCSEFQSEHFILRSDGIDIILKDEALDALEKAYRLIGTSLSHYPQDKINVEVYSTKTEFSAATTLPENIIEKSGTVGICKFNKLMILSPSALPLGYRWLDTLAHEYTHLVINRISCEHCPLWLHEGIAHYHDTLWRSGKSLYLSPDTQTRLAGSITNNNFIPFSKMHPSLVYLDTKDDIALAFAEVSNSVDFLIENYGKQKLTELLKAMVNNDTDTAFKKALGINQKKFESAYRDYLKNQHYSKSSGAINDLPEFEKKDEESFIGADVRGQIRIGDRMRAIGRFDAAIIQYKSALSKEPDNPVIGLKIAKAHISSGNNTEAEKILKNAIEKNPNYVTLYQTLGELYFNDAKYKESAQIYEEAVSINPFHPATRRNLSRCYISLNQPAKALNELSAAIALDPSDVESKVLFERFDFLLKKL